MSFLGSARRRYIEERIFKVFMLFAMSLAAFCLFLIVLTILVKGLPALNWTMLTSIPKGGFYIGKEGGILNAIVGSLYMAIGASFLGLLISLPIALYLRVYLRRSSWLAILTRLTADVLFGIPSIVYGAFGFIVMIFFGLKASLLAGVMAVTLLVIPMMIRTIDEVAGTVPRELLDASYSLGATRLETAKVLIRQISPGIFTAILLSFGRAAGEAAAVLFTAGFSDNIPTRLTEPVATLPLAIFFQLGSPMEKVQNRAYASAIVLTVIVLIMSLAAQILGKRFSRHKI